jgi:PAS domain S-box-containing protein
MVSRMNGRRASAPPPLIKLDSPFSSVIAAAIVGLLSYLAARLGGALLLRPQMVWPLWPGCALLVALLSLTRRNRWPLLLSAGLAGFVLYDLPAGLTLRSSGILVLGDSLEVLVATLGLNYGVGQVPRLDSVRSLARYVLLAVILAPISAAFAGTLALGGSYWVMGRIYFLTEALALLTLTPAILGLVHVALTWRQLRARFLEAAAMMASLVLFGYIIFVSSGSGRPELLYLLVPFLLWSALRFGIVGTSCAATAIAFLSISGAVHGHGPFIAGGPLNDVLSLQFFLLFAGTPFMFLAALAEEDQRGERALRESEKRFRLVANSAPVMIWMAGPDKLATDFNQSWLDFTGRPIEAELGNGWTEGVHCEDLPRCLDTYRLSFDRRDDFRLQYRLRRHDGEYRWVLANGVPTFLADGTFTGYIGTCLDVTERKHAEDRLTQARERLQLAMDTGHIGGWEWDSKTGRNIWFGKAHEILGMTPDEPSTVVEAFWERVHPEDRARLRETLDTAKQNHTEFNHEFRVVWRDGTVHWLRSRGSYFYAADGSPERMLGISLDITERKRTQEALGESEARFRFAAEAGRMFAYEWDLTTDVVIRSQECAAILGLSGDATRTTDREVMAGIHPDDRPRLTTAVAGLTPEHPVYRAVIRVFRPDGGVAWLERTGRGFFDDRGKLTKVIGMGVDISERKQAEDTLRQSEERFRSVFRDAGVGMFIVSPDGRFLSCNGTLCNYLGYREEELLEKSIEAITLSEDWPAFAQKLSEAITLGHSFKRSEKRWVHRTGRVVYTESSACLIRDREGKPQYFVGEVLDLTERKQAEEVLSSVNRRLIEGQEHERIRIARELHDDINQRLALLMVEMEQLKMDLARPPEEIATRMNRLAMRVSEISRDVQVISHELHSSKLEYLGVVPAMKAFCKDFAERQKLKIEFDADAVPPGIPREISLCLFRVLQEALHNAAKHSQTLYFKVQIRSSPGEITLLVSDSGVGFDPEGERGNRGLGLVSMRERVRLVKGTIMIESKAMGGTSIQVRVPFKSESSTELAAS